MRYYWYKLVCVTYTSTLDLMFFLLNYKDFILNHLKSEQRSGCCFFRWRWSFLNSPNQQTHAGATTHIFLSSFSHYFFRMSSKGKMWYGFLVKRTNTGKWRLTWESLRKESLNTKSWCFSPFNPCSWILFGVQIFVEQGWNISSCLSWRIAGPWNSNSLLPKKRSL